MPHFLWGLAVAALVAVVWRLSSKNGLLRSQLETIDSQLETIRLQLEAVGRRNEVLQCQLAEAIEQLARREESDAKHNQEGLFQRAVEGLIALGVPGLVLLVAVATSGFAGAAALTSALAALGGPFGMVGGIGVLLLLVLVSKAVASYGLPLMAQAVVRGLVAKGESPESIRRKLDLIPRWVLGAKLRAKIDETLNENIGFAAA